MLIEEMKIVMKSGGIRSRINLWLWHTGRGKAAKRQRGNAATQWPITVLLSNGSVTEPLTCRVLCARAIIPVTFECFIADASARAFVLQ